jgi:hypothetical protein
MIQKRQDGVGSAALLLGLPPAFYAAVHWAALTSWTHLWGLTIVAAAPCCLLLALDGAPRSPSAMQMSLALLGAMDRFVSDRQPRAVH